MTCESAQRVIEDQFAGELAPAEDAPLRAHLASCPGCRALYDQLARVDAFLERSNGGLSPTRAAGLERSLLSRVAAPPPAGDRPLLRWLMPALGAAALLVLALPLSRFEPRPSPWQSRAGVSSAFGVRAFCVRPGPPPEVTGEARPGGTLACAPGAALQFTYTAPSDARLEIAVAGADLRFFPGADGLGQVVSGTDVPLPFSTRVDASWLSGPVDVQARFVHPVTSTVLGESRITLAPSAR